MKVLNKKSFSAVFVSVSLLALLSGCSLSRNIKAINTKASQDAVQKMDIARKTQYQSNNFIVDNSFFAAKKPLDDFYRGNKVNLPEKFSSHASLNIPSSVDLDTIAKHVSVMSGYRVLVSPDLLSSKSSKYTETTLPYVTYSGTLKGLLDYVAQSLNASWKWTGQNIKFFKYETRMFTISALMGKTSVSTGLSTSSASTIDTSGGGSGGSSSSGNTGNSGQSSKTTAKFNIWQDVSDSIKGVLSPGGTFTASPTSGTITVRDTPLVISKVAQQIRQFNQIYTKQVMINVEVYSVERNTSDQKGVNWNVLWQSAADKWGLSFLSNAAGNLGSNVSAPGFSGVIKSGPFKGTKSMFNMLSSIGRTTLLTSGTVSTLNGQAVPLNVSRQQAYLQSYSTTLTSGDAGNSTTTLTPGVVNAGFSMYIMPRILPDNRVLMRYSINLSSIDSITTFKAPDGNSAIQLPERSVRNFIQNVSMRSGQTLVLTGFQQTQGAQKKSGPFSPSLWGFGGKKDMSSLSRTIVIVMTPYVIK